MEAYFHWQLFPEPGQVLTTGLAWGRCFSGRVRFARPGAPGVWGWLIFDHSIGPTKERSPSTHAKQIRPVFPRKHQLTSLGYVGR
jgi:hypothetical protein